MESDAYGDLDNYAKQINDGLKDHDGIIIDDCQICRLGVSFELSTYTTFDLEIRAVSDDGFVLKKGLTLYGMPDGLFYPQARAVWGTRQIEQITTFDTYAGLLIWETMTRNKRALRHQLRRKGASRLEAFRFARPVMPLQLGSHRSRAIASGIEMVEHAAWRAGCAEFRASGADNGRIVEVERVMADIARSVGEVGERF